MCRSLVSERKGDTTFCLFPDGMKVYSAFRSETCSDIGRWCNREGRGQWGAEKLQETAAESSQGSIRRKSAILMGERNGAFFYDAVAYVMIGP